MEKVGLLRAENLIDSRWDEIDVLVELRARVHGAATTPQIIQRVLQTDGNLLKIGCKAIPACHAGRRGESPAY